MTRWSLYAGAVVLVGAVLSVPVEERAVGQAQSAPTQKAVQPAQKGTQPPKKKAGPEPPATDPKTMKVAKGFRVELLYSVPKNEQGSWVCLCVDPKGRLIVSDQYGPLYRVTPPPLGQSDGTKVEKIPAPIGSAQGLLWAFDSLYVVVNAANAGLYRVTSSRQDDTLDQVELLRRFEGGGGEHGPHAVVLHPDGKRLTVVCGNQTRLTRYDTTRVPPVWGEDHLLPRLPDGNGFMKGVLGPGGAIYHVSPDGKHWELFSVGFRNQYDVAYHKNGDLFTYDSDMEWDMNTPWYRPTRVCLITSGSEFGWRNGAGKYPPYYPDNLPPVLNVGPGSPTGVCFGYQARFPRKYQEALFICDWSYGKLYAVHLKPQGSAYTAELEEFLSGTPLPLTDIVINPHDGAMYFTIGGRRTKSGLYRVTYVGDAGSGSSHPGSGSSNAGGADAAPANAAEEEARAAAARQTRLELERYHAPVGEAAVTAAWKELNSPDRFIQFAARVVLEHQDPKLWADKALAETDPVKATHALLALIRVSAPCPEHTPEKKVKGDPALRGKILQALARINWSALNTTQRLDLIRVYHVLFNRFGPPTAQEREAYLQKYRPLFPTGDRYVDGELLQVLVYLQDETVAPKAMKLLAQAPTQEEQLEYVRALRMLRAGWTPELRRQYFLWFVKAANYKGGASFANFLKMIKADAVATLSPTEQQALADILQANPATLKLPEEAPRPFVKAWTMEDLAPLLDPGLQRGRNFDRGRRIFATAKCFACHRFDNEGGSVGPDLTGVAGRFSPRDLLESILEPSKEISDQYQAVEILTKDERVVVGRIVNLNNDVVMVNTDMLNPASTVSINRNNIESMKPSKISMMPAGLLDTYKPEEILDLLAYMLSRGDRQHPMFRP
jgi:putative heme-binding domain-containing protein